MEFQSGTEGRRTNGRTEDHYPVKSIHDFLLEVQGELGRLRIASLAGMAAWLVVSLVLIHLAMDLIEWGEPFPSIATDVVLLALAALSVVYSAYVLYRQNRFFRKWGRRFELLQGVEEKLLGEKK